MRISTLFTRLALSVCLLLCGTTWAMAADNDEEIRLTTMAAAGQHLRIQLDFMSDATISGGASKGTYYGDYVVTDPTKDIVISGKVEQIECYGCQLTAVDVTKATSLQILRCYNNSISALDVSHCAELNTLDCHANQLATLDVSANAKLERLNCADNQLASIAFASADNALTRVECGDNQLASIDLSALPALTDFYAENNLLTTIDFSHNPKLNWVKVQGNKIASGMTDMIASLPTTTGQALIYIVDTRNENEGNQCMMMHVVAAGQRGWITCDWAGGLDTGDMTGIFYYGLDYEPDYGNRTITLSTDKMMGQTVTLDINSGGHDIDIDGVAEKAPYVGKQTFTITKPLIVIKGSVVKLNCSGNGITTLAFGGDTPVLTDLDCSDNQLQTLALDNFTSLQNLKCQQNQISSLTVTGCDALQRIDCYRNQIKGLYMSMLVKSLPTSTDSPYFFLIDTKAPAATPEGNECTIDDASAAKDKGWRLKDYANGANYGFGQDFGGSDDVLPEQYVEFSREEAGTVSFSVTMNHAADVPVLKGADIVSWNGQGLMLTMTEPTTRIYGDVKELTVAYSGLKTLDVSHLTNLTDLNCALNDLSSLDVTHNSRLAMLSCEINNLTSLDVSGTQLDYLNCYGNRITGADMTSLVRSLPSRIGTSTGMFIVVDNNFFDEDGVSQEHNVCTISDVAVAKDKNWTAYDLNGGPDTMLPYNGVDPTGIHDVNVDTQTPNILYNLSGQRVNAPAHHGVYIRNGKKVMY